MSVCKYRAFIFLDQPPPWPSRTVSITTFFNHRHNRYWVVVVTHSSLGVAEAMCDVKLWILLWIYLHFAIIFLDVHQEPRRDCFQQKLSLKKKVLKQGLNFTCIGMCWIRSGVPGISEHMNFFFQLHQLQKHQSSAVKILNNTFYMWTAL
jgi:hypothetical protein